MSQSAVPLRTRRLVCGSRVIPYTIRPSPRARCLRLTIRPDTGLVVTVPRADENHPLEPFLKRHQPWIIEQMDRLAGVMSRVPPRWPYGSTLPYRGREHRVVLRLRDGAAAVARLPERILLVQAPRPTLEGARRLLKRWYLAEALRRLTSRTRTLGGQLGLSWRRVTVRNQRWRWGSCSRAGRLSFNYRLIMAPPAVMDYVVLHELCHLRHPNHSSRFWTLVASHCPAYQESRGWLRRYGWSLCL